MPRRRPSVNDLTREIPSSPGVYFFYDRNGTLLYVGKSKALRSRVRAHFRDRSERWMMQRVERIEHRTTAGELGALLLELRLIKELRPMYNVASKQKRRIVLAERKRTPGGYDAVVLRAVDSIDPNGDKDILGVFKHKTQAREFLGAVSRTHSLCHNLLGLERSRTYCFAFHIGRCRGACCGEEPAEAYNDRLASAFHDRRIQSWPYRRGIIVRESSGDRAELFLVENWCLMGSVTRTNGKNKPFGPSAHRFDYDTYKILYDFITHRRGGVTVRTPGEREWERLLSIAGRPVAEPA